MKTTKTATFKVGDMTMREQPNGDGLQVLGEDGLWYDMDSPFGMTEREGVARCLREVEAWVAKCKQTVDDTIAQRGNLDVASGICQAVEVFYEQHGEKPPGWTQI